MASPEWKRNCSKRLRDGEKPGSSTKMPVVKLADVMCPVCLCILIEPVTMPCSHNLCMPCFQQNVQETSLLCPICRKRISSWSRKASRNNCLVNKVLWQTIQNVFPDKVKRRQLGKDNVTEEDSSDDEMRGPPVKLSKPGEIRKEYEIQLKRLHEENEKERERECQQSSALIKEIQEEEQRLRIEAQRLSEKDHVIALLITQQIQEAPAVDESEVIDSVLSNIDEVLRPATACALESRRPILVDSRRPSSGSAIPRVKNFYTSDKKSSSAGDKDEKCKGDCRKATLSKDPLDKHAGKLSRSNSIDSNDSITPELRHFRPIKTAPKTPPLRLPDGRIQETPLIHATPRALVFDLLLSEPERNDLLHRRLTSIEEDRRKRFDGGSNMNRVEFPYADRKLNLFRPLAPFSASPGNCALGTRPEKKYAISDLVANKENPKSTGRKRKLHDNGGRMEIAKKRKGMLGQGDVNVPKKQNLQPKPQASRFVSKSQALKSGRSKLLTSGSQASALQSQGKVPGVEKRRRQEESDRLLALKLHKELNCKRNMVDRRIGTKGEYNLRSRDNEVSFQQNTTSSF